MHAPHRKHVDHCLNCGAATPGAFCSACGQEAIDAAVTFRDQMAHFFEEVFSFESRLPQTLKTLFVRPGALTKAYNSGQRVRFVTPLKLYLFASVVFFVMLSFSASRAAGTAHVGTGQSEGFGVRIVPLNSSTGAAISHPASGKSPNEWKSVDEFDTWLKVPGNEKAMPPFIQPHVRSMLKSPAGFLGSLVDIVSRASMVLVPIHALLLKLMYWRPRRLYGEHIVFSLHVHSFAYVALTLASPLALIDNGDLGSVVETLVTFGYVVAAARVAYGEGTLRSTFKMGIVGLGYAIALVAVLAVTAAGAFFTT